MLDAVRSHGGQNAERDFCMITLFLNTGMRLPSLREYRLRTWTASFGRFSVIGKGNKERIIYLNDAAAAPPLSEYLPIRVAWPVKDKNEEAPFLEAQNV